LNSLNTAAAQTLQAQQATAIPVGIDATSTPIFILSSPTSSTEPATVTAATPTLASAMTDSKGVEMLLVPAGSFTMGSEHGASSEAPIHVIALAAFYIDKYEVTNAQYKKCVDDLVCDLPAPPRMYIDSRLKDHPAVYVNWDMANAYCEWRGARLPTEAEWEKAARGDELLEYPWGDKFDGKLVNFCDAHCSIDGKDKRYSDGYENTAPVGSYEGGKSPYGVYDMAGNVREWVADWYSESYYADSPKRNPPGPDTGTLRVLRGGSWVDNLNNVRTFARDFLNPAEANSYVGFRCVMDAVP
jgi:formylglycine-generating enzyme required for sulfatase activity